MPVVSANPNSAEFHLFSWTETIPSLTTALFSYDKSGLSLGKDEYETIDIHRRYFFIAGYQWLLFRNRSIMLEPSVMIQTTEETVADFYKNIDINLKLYTQSIYFGTSLRVNQSMAFFTLYQFRNIFGGLSYEIPFSKAINMMTVSVQTGNERLADFAALDGMSAEEFSRSFRQAAAGAVIAFTEGLGNKDRHGTRATVLLDELGLADPQ